MTSKLWIAAAAALCATNASAQAVKSTVTASNGVEVTVYSDDFANRYEYSAPAITIPDGFVLVASVKQGGAVRGPELTGSFSYVGEWRRYNSALFKGGDPASFVEAGRNVGRCFSSRYSRPSCTLMESFKVTLTSEDIRKHSSEGILPVQVRAQDTTTALLNVPVSYIDAVNEVSGKK